MPRKREVRKREILPDPKYRDTLIAKFINGIMRRGKKSVAEHIFYRSLDIIKERTQSDPLKTFKQAMDNVRPLLEVRPRRVGGATYQVPVEVRPARKTGPGDPMDHRLCQTAFRKNDGRKACRRVDRRSQQSRGCD